MANTTLTTDQQVTLTLAPVTALGNPATIVDVPLWTSSSIGVITLVVAANGLSAIASSVGVGTSTISVIGNGGTDAAPVQITGSVALSVTQAPAASLNISVSQVILK